MSRKRTWAISSWISFLTSAGIPIRAEMLHKDTLNKAAHRREQSRPCRTRCAAPRENFDQKFFITLHKRAPSSAGAPTTQGWAALLLEKNAFGSALQPCNLTTF